ncbi:MAG TPA: hypothetical protein VF101_14510 [Gaiellaceae bacterium]
MTRVSRPGRLVAYAAAGWGVDACFTALNSLRRTGRPRRSSLWNAPVYALAQPLFEPLHDRLRGRSVAARGLVYGGGILAVEYTAGRVFRRTLGRAPWDYSYARYHVDGLVRPDFLPLWAIYGLALERVHDALT